VGVGNFGMREQTESQSTGDSPPGATATARRAWVETAIITLIAPITGWMWNAQDPFFLQARIPWIVIAPLIIGLHHGSARALTSGLCLLAGAYGYARLGHAPPAPFPMDYAVGMGLLGLLAGEYRDAWQRVLHRLRHDAAERGTHLDRLTRAYHLLKRSHDLLEQRLASGGPSLHAILDRVQVQLEIAGERGLSAAADAVLRLFGDYGQVQVASLHTLRDGRIEHAPVAELGKAPPLDPEHPMVRDAIRAGTLTSVREECLSTGGFAPLACVPLIDVNGRVWGLVIVHEMPFMSMHDEHLALMAVFGGRVGDWMAERAALRQPPAPVSLRSRLLDQYARFLGR
jgi:polysaccharide biosynthesis protein PelD